MFRATCLVIFALCLFTSAYSQQEEKKLNQMTMVGSVELKEVADEASFTFKIKGVGETLRMAVTEAENKTRNLTEKLIQLGIKKKNISTSQFYSGENYGDKAFLSDSRDYKAEIVTLIKIDSLELLRSVLFEVSEAKVAYLSNIYFSYKDELSLRRRARIEASLKAKEKAEDITEALGVKIVKVLSIEEIQPTLTSSNDDNYYMVNKSYPNPFNPVANPYNTINVRGGRSEFLDESIGSGLFAQTISVTSQVKVTYEIE